MQIKEVDLEKTELFSIGRQYSKNVLAIHFVNLPNQKNKYIYYKIDDIEEEIPLVSDLFIVSRPLTMHSGKVKAQIIVRDEANETIDLTKNFTMIIEASNYNGIGEDENYPDDPNIKNYFVKIDEKVNSFEELANLVQSKLDNGEFVGEQGPKGEKGDPGEKGEPGDVTEEYRNLASRIAQNASDAQTSATNAQNIFDDAKTFANQTKTELNQIKTDTNTLKDEANTSAVNAKASETKAKEYADNLQASTDDISKLKEDLTDIVTLDDSFPLSESMFQMGYIDAVVGNVPVYRSSTSRFVTKEGTSFTFKKGTIIHVNTSALEQYGVAFQITKLNSDGTISSVNGLYYQDYVVPSDGKYILMFRTNWTQDIPSISDYLTQVSIDNNTPIVDVSNSYGKYISNEVDTIPFTVMDGLYQVNGVVGTQDTRNLEQYTNKIKVPTSRHMIFEQALSTAKDMFVRCVTFDADGTLLGYETPMDLVFSSSTKLEIKVADNVEYVVFTFRSYGLTTNVKIYADNPANKSKYTPFHSLITPPKVPLINHRGYETLAPENSIPAFTLAGERGAFGVECDVSSTSDGVLIIMHDNTVDRTTDGSGTVTSLTYAQIQQMHIDAGANVDQYSQEELVIPTFEDFIKICRKYGMVATIEVKLYGDLGNYVTSMLNIIYKYGMQNNVMILTINADVIKMFRAYDKDVQITLFCTNTSVIDDYKDYRNMGISIDKSTSNIGNLAEYAHSNNMLVSIYIAEDTTEEENLKQYFPDFITTETTLNE